MAAVETPAPGDSLDDLHRAVSAAIAGGRIGVPVFVRYTLHAAERGGNDQAKFAETLAQLANLVTRWLNQPLLQIHAVGSLAAGQAVVTLRFEAGGTALLSVSLGSSRPGADLLVLGNHGSLHHDVGHARIGTSWGQRLASPPEKNRDEETFSRLIRQALQTGKPQDVPREGRP